MSEENESSGEVYISALRVSSLQLHEIYQELKSVGFQKREALFLVGQILVSGILVGFTDDSEFDDEDDERDEEDDDGDFF